MPWEAKMTIYRPLWFCPTLATSRATVVIVLHANHPRELDAATARSFACLKNAGLWLFNQAVLLRGVNDRASTLIDLCHGLFNQGVLPYYLHMLDRVEGTHHFEVNEETAQSIYRSMQAQLPGYLLPKLVREVPGSHSKDLIAIAPAI